MARLATGLVLLPTLYLVVVVAPRWVFYGVAALTFSLACMECYRMLESGGGRPFKWLGLLALWALIGAFAEPGAGYDPSLPLVAVTLVTVALAMALRRQPSEMLQTATSTLFPVLFIGLALSYLIGLRVVPSGSGSTLVMFLFFCVIAADTTAYYVGSTFGRHRMAPSISPKKSWEGAAGGLAGSVLAALAGRALFYGALPLEHALILGIVLGLASMVGDLGVSVVKRATGVKDSSSLLPGHGGMLDRMDSLLFASPLLYYYYIAFLQGVS